MRLPLAMPIAWAVPDLSARAAEVKAELGQLDLSRDELLTLIATHRSHGEWLERLIASRERDMRLRALAFPECCQAPLGFEGFVRGQYCSYVSSRLQLPFKGCRLAVDPECAPFFDIVDLRVGQSSSFINADSIPATLFPPLPSKADAETHGKLVSHMPIGHVGIDMTLGVRLREEGNGRVFRAAIWGRFFET